MGHLSGMLDTRIQKLQAKRACFYCASTAQLNAAKKIVANMFCNLASKKIPGSRVTETHK